jgi:hypothetical protein
MEDDELDLDHSLNKIVPDTQDEIMHKYLLLRRGTISYWNFFTFSFGVCIFFPMIKKFTQYHPPVFGDKILLSTFIAYLFYKMSLKYFIRTFNSEWYSKYRVYCLKYNLEDNLLL